MARIHRWVYLFIFEMSRSNRKSSDGQKRPVFIYRFLTAGSIDGTVSLMVAELSLILLRCRENLSETGDETRFERLYVFSLTHCWHIAPD